MTCFDIFCFMCGNPCRAWFDAKDVYREFLNEAQYNKEYYFYNEKHNARQKIEDYAKNNYWMYECTFLTATNEIIHGCREQLCNIVFAVDNNSKKYLHSTTKIDFDEHGVFIHSDCWNYVKKKYNIELKFSNLPIGANANAIKNTGDSQYKVFPFVDYGSIEQYWYQEFFFDKILLNGDEDMCQSPLKKENVLLNKVYSQLKIKKDRPSPLVSASFYKNGTIKIGNNNKFYAIKNGKWVLINDNIVALNIVIDKTKKNKSRNYYKSLSYIGSPSLIPVFIKSQIINKNEIHAEILTFSHLADKVKQKFHRN